MEVFAFIGVLSGHISDITLDYIIGNISFYKLIVTHDRFICFFSPNSGLFGSEVDNWAELLCDAE